MVDEKEKIRIIEEDIKEIKKEENFEDDAVEEEEFQEQLEEELVSIEEDSSVEGSFSPLLDSDDEIQDDPKRFVLDDLKDVDIPSQGKKKKRKTEEIYSSKTAGDFYNNGASPGDLYKGINPDQGPVTGDFYEQSSLDAFYNKDSSGGEFYAIPTELEEEKDNTRVEAPKSLENKFEKDKKDDLMFRS